MTSESGGILSPTLDDSVNKYAPFFNSKYPHIKYLQSHDWSNTMDMGAFEHIYPDPFVSSTTRKEGMAIWDASIAAPACVMRTHKITHVSEIGSFHQTNKHWLDTAMPAMSKVGPLGDSGKLLRPEGPWIFDLTTMDNGWELIEAAHVMTHARGDYKAQDVPFSRTAERFRHNLCTLVVSQAFGIPFTWDPYDTGTGTMPEFRATGVKIHATDNFIFPYTLLSWMKDTPLIPDVTRAVMTCATYTQPHPYGYNSGTMAVSRTDHWSCMPTVVAIAGWQVVDMITHMPLYSRMPKNKHVPICYGIHPADLIEPDMFKDYLNLAEMHDLQYDETGYLVNEFLVSGQYRHWLAQTPTLPCKHCMAINLETDNAPRRPKGLAPKPGKLKDNAPWEDYYKSLELIHQIREPACMRYERRRYRGETERPTRRARNRAHKQRLRQLKEEHWLENARQKLRAGKNLTSYEARVYREYKRNIRSTRNDEHSSI